MSLNVPQPKIVPVPKVSAGRTAEPNPYEPIVKELADKRDTARAFPFPLRGEDDVKNLKRHKNALQRAGTALNVSVRTRVAVDEKAGTATVTAWVVDKITRAPAKTESKAEETKAENKPGTVPAPKPNVKDKVSAK